MSKKNLTEAVREIIRKEFHELVKEAEKDYKKIEESLETLRKKSTKGLVPESATKPMGSNRVEKRIQLKTVSELTDIPVNELMLYFLNCVKNRNDRSLIEYHLGHVYFYGDGAE